MLWQISRLIQKHFRKSKTVWRLYSRWVAWLRKKGKTSDFTLRWLHISRTRRPLDSLMSHQRSNLATFALTRAIFSVNLPWKSLDQSFLQVVHWLRWILFRMNLGLNLVSNSKTVMQSTRVNLWFQLSHVIWMETHSTLSTRKEVISIRQLASVRWSKS